VGGEIESPTVAKPVDTAIPGHFDGDFRILKASIIIGAGGGGCGTVSGGKLVITTMRIVLA
jgi:hypothetical protein